ncbi:MAG: ACP S-malonyltransferase [Puniceicoccales bacterium]|jgi:[acyl-carrier-protein] S-malonyltransferase|nr:ACP S-malonyltransferase [Puniceicoccales bacterium]
MGQAVMFSGQGAQFVGMGQALQGRSRKMWECFERAGALLGYDISRICFQGPPELLAETIICQPALFTVGWGAFLTLQEGGFLDGLTVCCGQSLGEWVALVATGIVTFEDGLHAVSQRARFMQDACEGEEGAMAAFIGGQRPRVLELCALASVTISNFNAPDQVVISGKRENVAEAITMAEKFGIRRAVALNVAGAYHCSMMATAKERFAEVVESLPMKCPCVPFISNVTGKVVEDPEEIRRLIIEQIVSPVRWEDCMKTAWELGARTFYECGAGKVLVGLCRKNLPDARAISAEELPV